MIKANVRLKWDSERFVGIISFSALPRINEHIVLFENKYEIVDIVWDIVKSDAELNIPINPTIYIA